MTALALASAPEPDRRRCHATREEYFARVRATFADPPASIKSRRYSYNRFLKHWPDLEDWFTQPLLIRLDLHGRDPHEPGKRIGPSHEAGPHLAYLSLVHGLRLDAGYVLSRNFDSLFVPKAAVGLGLGLGLDLDLLDSFSARILQLGYAPVSGRSVLTWTSRPRRAHCSALPFGPAPVRQVGGGQELLQAGGCFGVAVDPS
ncbi:hypothetical protein ACIP46_39305 [Streptomyces lavendulae]|uniref:hypothetical protein n=1 Tax=Streptomyces lavendulae TaxID=1914 RepID=UPI003804B31F